MRTPVPTLASQRWCNKRGNRHDHCEQQLHQRKAHRAQSALGNDHLYVDDVMDAIYSMGLWHHNLRHGIRCCQWSRDVTSRCWVMWRDAISSRRPQRGPRAWRRRGRGRPAIWIWIWILFLFNFHFDFDKLNLNSSSHKQANSIITSCLAYTILYQLNWAYIFQPQAGAAPTIILCLASIPASEPAPPRSPASPSRPAGFVVGVTLSRAMQWLEG